MHILLLSIAIRRSLTILHTYRQHTNHHCRILTDRRLKPALRFAAYIQTADKPVLLHAYRQKIEVSIEIFCIEILTDSRLKPAWLHAYLQPGD